MPQIAQLLHGSKCKKLLWSNPRMTNRELGVSIMRLKRDLTIVNQREQTQ